MAGLLRYLRARTDSCGWASAQLDHHCSGQSVLLMVDSALCRLRALLHCTSSSESESKDNGERRRLLFFAHSCVGVSLLHCSYSGATRLVQTSSHFPFARHFKSLKHGSSTIAILSHSWLSVSMRWNRYFMKAVLNFTMWAVSSSETFMVWCRWQRAGKTTEHETSHLRGVTNLQWTVEESDYYYSNN